jgi:hypothetical protein
MECRPNIAVLIGEKQETLQSVSLEHSSFIDMSESNTDSYSVSFLRLNTISPWRTTVLSQVLDPVSLVRMLSIFTPFIQDIFQSHVIEWVKTHK